MTLTTVCASCGTPVSQSRSGLWLHTEELDKNVAEHDVDTVIDRQDYMFGESKRQDEVRAPAEIMVLAQVRQAEALEEIRDLLRTLVERQRMDT